MVAQGEIPVVAIDEQGDVIHANEAARSALDAEGSLEGSRLWRHLPEPERDRFREACRRARREEETVQVDIPWRQEERWYRLQAFPTGDNLSVHLQDITADKRENTELKLRERSLREACEIVTDSDAGPRDRIKRLLTTIRGTLGTEFATLSYVDPDQGAYHFDAVGSADEDALPEGETIPLDELPICARVAQKEETVVLNDVADEAPGLVDETRGISAYIGSPVHVGGEVYGTFCFYSTERRTEAFTGWEVTYVELFSDFASAELDRLVTDAVTIDPPIVSGSSANST